MDILSQLRGTKGRPPDVLRVLLVGESTAAADLRDEIHALCRDFSARGALLLGPPGIGKSTIARAIAFCRYLHRIRNDRAAEMVQKIDFDGPARLDKRHIDWYEEISLTGLVEGLADSQLFGIRKGAATGVQERQGVFQRAMRGHVPTSDEPTSGAAATGGVVLLDEVGDLPNPLQPKLLLILTGAEVFMVGGEGDSEYGYSFNGLTIAATWQDPAQAGLRPDLVSRLSDHVISIPSLTERPEDIESMARLVLAELRRSREQRFRKLIKTAPAIIDHAQLREDAEVSFEFDADDIRILRTADWRSYGELRGLAQVVSRAAESGLSIEAALDRQLKLPRPDESSPDPVSALLDVALEIPCSSSMVGHIRSAEHRIRERLAARLRHDQNLLRRLSDHLDEDPIEVRKRLSDLTRRRTE